MRWPKDCAVCSARVAVRPTVADLAVGRRRPSHKIHMVRIARILYLNLDRTQRDLVLRRAPARRVELGGELLVEVHLRASISGVRPAHGRSAARESPKSNCAVPAALSESSWPARRRRARQSPPFRAAAPNSGQHPVLELLHGPQVSIATRTARSTCSPVRRMGRTFHFIMLIERCCRA